MEITVPINRLKEMLKIDDENISFTNPSFKSGIMVVYKKDNIEITVKVREYTNFYNSCYTALWSERKIIIHNLEHFKEEVLVSIKKAKEQMNQLI